MVIFMEILKITATFRQSNYYADARYLCVTQLNTC